MIKYLRKDTKNGRVMYFRNGKMISAKEIPNSILLRLEDGVEITTDTPDPETIASKEDIEVSSESKKVCLFCGQEAVVERFINLQTIRLCQDDARNHTTGEIVAQLREG